MEDGIKGIIGSLKDLSFTEFVTTRLIKILYVLAIIFAGLSGLGIIAGGLFSGNVVRAVIAIIMGPVVFVLMVLSARIWLELVIVMFRIAEHTAAIAQGAGAEGAALSSLSEEKNTKGKKAADKGEDEEEDNGEDEEEDSDEEDTDEE